MLLAATTNAIHLLDPAAGNVVAVCSSAGHMDVPLCLCWNDALRCCLVGCSNGSVTQMQMPLPPRPPADTDVLQLLGVLHSDLHSHAPPMAGNSAGGNGVRLWHSRDPRASSLQRASIMCAVPYVCLGWPPHQMCGLPFLPHQPAACAAIGVSCTVAVFVHRQVLGCILLDGGPPSHVVPFGDGILLPVADGTVLHLHPEKHAAAGPACTETEEDEDAVADKQAAEQAIPGMVVTDPCAPGGPGCHQNHAQGLGGLHAPRDPCIAPTPGKQPIQRTGFDPGKVAEVQVHDDLWKYTRPGSLPSRGKAQSALLHMAALDGAELSDAELFSLPWCHLPASLASLLWATGILGWVSHGKQAASAE